MRAAPRRSAAVQRQSAAIDATEGECATGRRLLNRHMASSGRAPIRSSPSSRNSVQAMSSAYRPSRWLAGLLSGAAVVIALHAARSAAAEPVVAGECDQQGCGFIVIAESLRVAPCRHRAVLVVYSAADGAALIQCSTDGDLEANLTYVFDRTKRTDPGVEVTATRFLKASALAQIIDEGVPDRFGPVPRSNARWGKGYSIPSLSRRQVSSQQEPRCLFWLFCRWLHVNVAGTAR